jgi:hypothetical protein
MISNPSDHQTNNKNLKRTSFNKGNRPVSKVSHKPYNSKKNRFPQKFQKGSKINTPKTPDKKKSKKPKYGRKKKVPCGDGEKTLISKEKLLFRYL